MTRIVTVENAGTSLSVSEDTTILQAALGAGVPYPYGCQAGRCGACKSRLISGEVDLLPHTPFSLTAKDKEAGFILACRARPRADCVVAWLGSDRAEHPLREETARVLRIERAAADISVISMRLEASAPLEFSAGQYSELRFPGCPPRNYSMANQPGSEVLEFHVRHVPNGATSGYVARELQVGERVVLRGPMGTAHLRARHTGPIVAIAGGSGLAPILSILGSAATLNLKQPIRLYFSARSESDLYREEQISALVEQRPNITYRPILRQHPGDRNYGALRNVLREELHELQDWMAYLAGSPLLVDSASEILLARGLRSEHCHADAFFTTAEQVQALAAS
jgi:ferredoxin-NAD(P)+ reductase (naphthalene dioxygenase ferredoxin-specific)